MNLAAKENDIHPTAVFKGDVKLGKNNKILPYCVLIGPVEIGDNNIIGPHVVIGSPGADTRIPLYDSSDAFIGIGNNNIIREFTAIQKPRYEQKTLIGNNVYLMQGINVSHDTIIEDKVVTTPMCSLAGIVKLLEGSYLGMGCTVHQRSVIGQFSIVATGVAIVKNVRPFSRYIPGKETSINLYAIEKYGYTRFTGEISEYVLRGVMPSSPEIGKIVERYEKLHIDSKRSQY